MADLDALAQAVAAGDRAAATSITRDALAQGVDPGAILDEMTGAMNEVGGRFQRNEIYVPEMLIAARAMKEAMVLLEPSLVGAGIRPQGTAVLGTVSGDLHDIGKNLVGMMWKGASLEVVDLGVNVPPARFVEAVREHDARIVGMSALLTTTMGGMKDVVAALRSAGLDHVKVIVGGAPVTEEFAREIGADAYAANAAAAAEVAQALLG